MDKLAKTILNSMKCPVCGGQIDMIEGIPKRGNNFGCVSGPYHYSVNFIHWEIPYRIDAEHVMIFHGRHAYDVHQSYYSGLIKFPQTSIIIRDIDAENRIIDGGDFKRFAYDKALFDFTKTNREKIINRIKTILVFQ
jgi:hypothetical protein